MNAQKVTRVFLLLGTNLGNREVNLRTAISLLVTEFAPYLFSEVTESSVLESEPVGFVSEDRFLNQAVAFDTSLSPEDVLKVCKYVEQKMGRFSSEPVFDEEGKRVYKSRVIDIDILLYGTEEVNLPNLKIPHPELKHRDFAMIPLKEVLTGEFADFFDRLEQ